jgi:hypothetical protein
MLRKISIIQIGKRFIQTTKSGSDPAIKQRFRWFEAKGVDKMIEQISTVEGLQELNKWDKEKFNTVQKIIVDSQRWEFRTNFIFMLFMIIIILGSSELLKFISTREKTQKSGKTEKDIPI